MFSDYTSIFSSPSFGTSSSINAFQGGPKSFLGSGSSGGGSKVDPFSIAMAGLGGVGSAVGGIFGSQAASQAAYQNAIMAGAGLQYKQAEALGSLGQARFNTIFPATTGGDLSFAREKEAEKFKNVFSRPQDLLYGSQVAERANLSRMTEPAKKAALFEAELNRRNQIGLDQSKLAGLFGETGFSRRFTG
jgi:hypothetical protein